MKIQVKTVSFSSVKLYILVEVLKPIFESYLVEFDNYVTHPVTHPVTLWLYIPERIICLWMYKATVIRQGQAIRLASGSHQEMNMARISWFE